MEKKNYGSKILKRTKETNHQHLIRKQARLGERSPIDIGAEGETDMKQQNAENPEKLKNSADENLEKLKNLAEENLEKLKNLAEENLEKLKKLAVNVYSNKINREDLRPGDHIYSWRQAYIYAHHGIYVGDGKVIHFTRGAGQEIGTGTILDRWIFSSSPSHPSESPCPNCGDVSRTDGVISSCLDCFLSGDDLYLFEYNVSSWFFLAKARGGTCSLAKSDPTEDVLHRSKFLLQNGFGVYHLFKNNCEDFAIYCKTRELTSTSVSVGRSGQISSILAACTAVVPSPLRFMTTSLPGLTAVVYGSYCLGRFVSDIGVRRDVTKIPVEQLVARGERSEVVAELAKED